MIIVMGEFRLNPESIKILRNEIAEVIKKSNEVTQDQVRNIEIRDLH